MIVSEPKLSIEVKWLVDEYIFLCLIVELDIIVPTVIYFYFVGN